MPVPLTNTDDIATESQNTAGQRDPILTFQPEDGTALIIKGMVKQGEDVGIPIYASFMNQNGNPIDPRSTLSLRFNQPGWDDAKTITHPLTNLSIYNSLTISEQRDTEKVDQVKHILKGSESAVEAGEMPKVVVGHLDDLIVSLESDDVIDWSHPETKFYIARQAVEEVN